MNKEVGSCNNNNKRCVTVNMTVTRQTGVEIYTVNLVTTPVSYT